MTGQTISHYEILAKIGEGGMGVVYKARDMNLGRLVALKFLHLHFMWDEQSKRRFVREAKAASALDHPNICTIYEVGETDQGQLFIAMAYYEGETLERKIGVAGLPVEETLEYVRQIANALKRAHRDGMVHRDIKPANIIVTADAMIKILDFGLAKWTASQTLTANQAVGTLPYMSPEQLQSEPNIDQRTDIWSLGVMFYQMLTGQLPFGADYDQAVGYAIINENPTPLHELRKDLPESFEVVVCGRLLAKSRDDRYEQVDELLADMETLRQDWQKTHPKEKKETQPIRLPLAHKTQLWLHHWRGRLTAAGVGLALIVLVWIAISSKLNQEPLSSSAQALTRLTSDPGLTFQPAVSPDGSLIAYSSDRDGDGGLDIWVQQLVGGRALQLTNDEADDTTPSFSSDGSQIVFRSERNGGGIFIMPTLGGEPRILSTLGQRPRLSPDGNWVAYSIGEEHVVGAQKIYVAPVAGGEPQRVQPDFAAAGDPVWSPDGQSLLFWGRRESAETAPMDWWIAPVRGGEALPTGTFALLEKQGLRSIFGRFIPEMWVDKGSFVLTSGWLGDSFNVWKIFLADNDHRAVRAGQLTFGTGNYQSPSLTPNGGVVFSSIEETVNVWSLPVDAQGRPVGQPGQLTTGIRETYPSVTADGKKIVFLRSGSRLSGETGADVVLKDLPTGRDVVLASLQGNVPIIAPNGSRVAYAVTKGPRALPQNTAIFVVDLPAGIRRQVCEGCGFPRAWTSDGGGILVEDRYAGLLDIASGKTTEVVRHPDLSVYAPSLSADNRWIAFHLRGQAGTRQIYVAPFDKSRATSEADWIPVTDGSTMDRNACWSPDGNLLYFLSERDGFRCVWAQRLNATSKHPVGNAFPVQHFHRRQHSLMEDENPGLVGLSATKDSVIFSLRGVTGNIWMIESNPRPP